MTELSRRLWAPAAAMLAALLLAGCQTGAGNSPTASAVPQGSRAIAFESIDGPPQPVFQKLVSSLSTEADTRNLQVVSREGEANYRVRGYLAASVEDGKGTVDWAWDVFDRERIRVLRIAGTEEVGKGSDVWGRCDQAVLDRIAAQSLDEIAARLDGKPATRRPIPSAAPEPAAVPDAPTDDGPPIASAVDDVPDDAVPPSGAAPALALVAPQR